MKPIYISRTLLPPLSLYNKYLKRIWKSNWLTNNGELVQELEEKLKKYWGVKNVVCVSNGTDAIMLAIKALGITKAISLSPNSFIATASAPTWLGIKLKFVDLGEKYRGPALVTHLYGYPQLVNTRPVIYDASHAFATKRKGKSILRYGDISIISFHATKLFQTIEGGAVVTSNDKIAEKIRWMRNFGFKTQYSFYGTGINCKMSEFHAAMGLCTLKLIPKILRRYSRLIERYNKAFGIGNPTYLTYYPIYYDSSALVEKAIKELNENEIYPRRYFYPPLNKVFKGKNCPYAEDKMRRVLCLPLYPSLTLKDQQKVIKIVKKHSHGKTR